MCVAPRAPPPESTNPTRGRPEAGRIAPPSVDESCAPAAAETNSNAARTTIVALRMHQPRPMEPRRRSYHVHRARPDALAWPRYRGKFAAIKLARMNSAFLISLVIQVTLIIHCIRTGRNSLWIWAIALLPLAGPIAYVLIELLPGLFGGRRTRRAVRGVRKVLDPEQDLRRFQDEARLIGDVASRQRFADELVRQGRADEAIGIYRQALHRPEQTEPKLV